jgi:predicted aspartyl protease
VDTGASNTVLNATFVAKLQERGLAKKVKAVRVSLADGTTVETFSYTVTRFTLGDCVVENETILELPPGGQNLLGRDVLSRLHADFNLNERSSKIHFKNCKKAVTGKSK